MYKLLYSKKFKRDLKKYKKDSNFKIEELNNILWSLVRRESLDKKYRNHKLKNEFYSCMECHVKPDLLLIYFIDDTNKEIHLYRLGTHSELFG